MIICLSNQICNAGSSRVVAFFVFKINRSRADNQVAMDRRRNENALTKIGWLRENRVLYMSADFLGAMVTNTSATTSTLFFGRDYESSAASIQELVKGVGSSIIVAQKGATVPDWTWTGA